MADSIDALLAELRKFSPEVAEFNGPADPAAVAAFESAHQLMLPADYKRTIAQMNGFSIMGDEVYGVLGPNVPLSIEGVYYREHSEVHLPQYPYLVPFRPDGGGNFYCFDTRHTTQGGASCPVVFWASNYQYTADDTPEVVSQSFVEFIKEVVIGSMLEEYDYEGNER